MKKIYKLILLIVLSLFIISCEDNNNKIEEINDKTHKVSIIDTSLYASVSLDTYKAKEKEVVRIAIKEHPGYYFSYYMINGVLSNQLSFVMPNSDVELVFVFINEEEKNKQDNCTHNIVNELCSLCGKYLQKSYLNELFGYNIDIYTNDEENPYNVDLNKYGSNVSVYFYTLDPTLQTDPYINVDKTEFYADYERATDVVDAYYRTKHQLMSGDITDQYYLPEKETIYSGDEAIKLTDATYILKPNGDYVAYIPNVLNEENYIIFYGAAYSSLNDVANYLLAFGEVPANTIHNKKNTNEAVSKWGKFGRVNYSRFSGDTTKYPYEPLLPDIKTIYYSETDFGTTGGYTNSNSLGTNVTQVVYNNGNKITRGAARMVFVSDSDVTRIDDRHVFYTYNHYNDFEEYLNYHNGWGVRFGNESAGNEYCYSTAEYNKIGKYKPTDYPQVILAKHSQI